VLFNTWCCALGVNLVVAVMDPKAIKSIESLQERMSGFESSLLSLVLSKNKESDGACNDFIKLVVEFDKFKSECLAEIKEIKMQFNAISAKCDDLEAYSRRNCVVIHGVKEVKGENVVELALKIINDNIKIDNFSIEMGMIDNCHRLGGGGKNGRPIIIKFTSFLVKNKIWTQKKQLKGTGIVMTESLTKSGAGLFKSAKDKFNSKNVWTRNGAIVVLLTGTKHIVTKQQDLDVLIKDMKCHPDSEIAGISDPKQGYNTRHAAKNLRGG